VGSVKNEKILKDEEKEGLKSSNQSLMGGDGPGGKERQRREEMSSSYLLEGKGGMRFLQ